MSVGIKVWAPATVANVACGYDILGFAINGPGDEIILCENNLNKLRITEISGAQRKLPYDVEKNTATFAAAKYLEHIGSDQGYDFIINKRMPFGSGLGSSAASAVAGVFAINEIQDSPLSKREILQFAMMGEQLADGAWHADNVAPCMLGGFTLIRDNASLDIHRIPSPTGLYATVIYPHMQVLTKDSRSVLSTQVSLENTITQSGNLGGLIVGLYQSDFDLISRSLNDVLIEHQRASLIEGFYDVKEAALQAGALGCSISGAGPSIFALSRNSLIAEQVGDAMAKVFYGLKIDTNLYVSEINQEGAFLF